jgi:signal transduction histidine kinase
MNGRSSPQTRTYRAEPYRGKAADSTRPRVNQLRRRAAAGALSRNVPRVEQRQAGTQFAMRTRSHCRLSGAGATARLLGRRSADVPEVYRGPDRRGRERTPPPLGLDDPRGRFWMQALAIALPCAVVLTLLIGLSALGVVESSAILASLRVVWCLLVLVAGIGLHLRWRLTGEAHVALLAVALVVMSAPQFLLALAYAAGADGARPPQSEPLTRAAVLIPTAWLLWRCLRTPEVDSSLRPLRVATAYSGAATVAAIGICLADEQGVIAVPTPGTWAVNLVVAAFGFGFAWGFGNWARSIPRPLSTRLAVVFAALGLASLVDTLLRALWLPPLLPAVFSLVSAILLLLIMLSLLRSVLELDQLRLLSLSLRVNSAEATVRREQERLHELRSTVSGLRMASGTLEKQQNRLEPTPHEDLGQMMVAELARLERLLEQAQPETRPATRVELYQVIRPLVVRHREQGVPVRWRSTSAFVHACPDEVATVVNSLLSNAHLHARGSPVELTVDARTDVVEVGVRDWGPGIPDDSVDEVFERGVRGHDSPGRGLGLYLGRRLAQRWGGELSLRHPAGPGALFVLTLPASSGRIPSAAPPQTPIPALDRGEVP